MKNALGWILGGLAAYFVYENWFAAPAVAAPVPAVGIIPASAPPTPSGGPDCVVEAGKILDPRCKVTLSSPLVSPKTPTFAGVLAKAQAAAIASGSIPADGSGTLSMDQWNYFVDQVTGMPNSAGGAGLDPAALFPDSSDRGGPQTFANYSFYAGQHGLSGRVPRRRANYVRY